MLRLLLLLLGCRNYKSQQLADLFIDLAHTDIQRIDFDLELLAIIDERSEKLSGRTLVEAARFRRPLQIECVEIEEESLALVELIAVAALGRVDAEAVGLGGRRKARFVAEWV